MSFRAFQRLIRRHWSTGYRVRYTRHEAAYAAVVTGPDAATVTVMGGPYQPTGRIYWHCAFIGCIA